MLRGTGWMYEGVNNEINKEEYLLGKKIGKNFEAEGTAGQINAVEYDVAPPSIFASRANHQVDLQRKLMEDPLVAIKKREVEDRKKLMDNPVKMKALAEHLKSLEKKSKNLRNIRKRKKSKHKKRKKYRSDKSDDSDADLEKLKKRKKHRSDSSDDSDADLDLKLLQKLQAMEKGSGGEEDSDEYESDDEAEQERKKKAILAAGIDPDNIEAPMFSAAPRKKGRDNSPEKGKGDWDCLKCGNWNFVRRTECFKCNTKKGEGKAPAPAPLFVPIPIAPIKKSEPTPLLKKKVTTALEKAEPGTPPSSPPSGRGGGPGSTRPGDWQCAKPGCNYSNFASRSTCNKCNTAKGSSGSPTPARQPYQRREGRPTSPHGTLLGSPSPPRHHKRSQSPTPRDRKRRKSSSPSRRKRRSSSPDRRHDRNRRRKSPSSPARHRGRRSPSTPPRYRRRSPGSPPRRQRSPPPSRKDDGPKPVVHKNKLSDAEKQAKLAEMMANAEWRDEQRTSRVGKYRKEQEKEEQEAKREHDPAFLARELKRAQDSLTVEARITANKHNIQRGVGVMDKNFAKR